MEPSADIRLHRILNMYAPVDRNSADLIFHHGSVSVFKKNEIVFHEGRFNAFEYFQLEGVSHRFNTDSESQCITTGIYQDEMVITPHFSRTRDHKSIFSLQALTECTYLTVPAGVYRDISEKNHQIRMFGRGVVEKEFIRHLNFEVLFRSYTAKDRLLYFREQYPLLENIIPHTVIASFLGITPVSFSRLRNDLAKK